MEYVTLKNGLEMPTLGYGVYQVTQDQCQKCVEDALETGYRLIDTAQSYFNEEQVGAAINASGIDRKEIFLTSKVWIEHYGDGKTRKSVEESLSKLQTDYLDLMLLHQDFGDVYGAWRDLEAMYKEGVIKAIGVSNFLADRLVDFCSFNEVTPLVNQVEINPMNQQLELKEWAPKYDVRLEAWAPFGEGRNNLFTNPILQVIADKHNKSTAQVMLRWNIQNSVVTLAKSVQKERMEQNFDIFDFELDSDDMAAIATLNQDNSLFFSFRDPNMVEWFAKMVEERKQNHNASTEKKAW